MPIYVYLCKSGGSFHKTDFPEKFEKIYQIAAIPLVARGFITSDKDHYVNFMKKKLIYAINSSN